MVLRRRPILIALGTAMQPLAAGAQDDVEQALERRAERWADLRHAIFGERRVEEAGGAVAIEAPARALDAATVPISLSLSPEIALQARAVHLIIDENPSPLAAVFRAGPAGDLRALSTRIRVDAYTFLHAVAETEDGRLLQAARFIKAAGGCSAPAGSDLRAARERMGRMRFTLPQGPPSPGRSVPVQVAVSHPNSSGLQIDQLTRLSIPAEFVQRVTIAYRGQEAVMVESDISIAENPTFGFSLAGEPGGELRVEAEDNKARRFTNSWTVPAAG
jgi:sulfur-oxidizing protein SoxY